MRLCMIEKENCHAYYRRAERPALGGGSPPSGWSQRTPLQQLSGTDEAQACHQTALLRPTPAGPRLGAIFDNRVGRLRVSASGVRPRPRASGSPVHSQSNPANGLYGVQSWK